MGVFQWRLSSGGVELACGEARNVLAYQGIEHVLRGFFPTTTTRPTYVMGLTGCVAGSASQRPNPATPGGSGIAVSPLMTFANCTDSNANEGGCYTPEMRTSFGYARKSITFSIAADGEGAGLTVAEQDWSNPHSWTPEAESHWDDPDTPVDIELAPPEWVTRIDWEPVVGFPWHRPRKLAYEIGGPTAPVQRSYFYAWQPDGSLDWLADFRALGGFPISGAFIADSSRNQLVAFGAFRQSLFLRPDTTLYVRYRAKLMSWTPAAGMVTDAFALRLAQCGFASGTPYTGIAIRPLLASAPIAGMGRRTTFADVSPHFAPDFGAVSLSLWSYVGYSAGPPEVLPHVVSVATPSWLNGTGQERQISGFAVFGVDGATDRLMWVTPSAQTIPAGDLLRIPAGVKFSILNL